VSDPVVIVAGVCEDHLPHKRSQDFEEEVRIWYVAATRARKRLIISMGGRPSIFLVQCGLVQEAKAV
jgi:superfamily I DNA/RNA helicase